MELDKVVEIAKAEAAAKVVEVGGDNRGPRVEEYQRLVKLQPGSPWCAAFVSWVATQANGTSKALPWCSGSAVTLWFTAQRRLRGTEHVALPSEHAKVQPGWIWVRSTDAAAVLRVRNRQWTRGHCGVVCSMVPSSSDVDTFRTVEGNTNSAGSRNGGAVLAKVQKLSDPRTVGWFDPVALTATYSKNGS